jgi:hypothetical protein
VRTRDDIEAYLARSNQPNREVAEDTWLVGAGGSDARGGIAVRIEDGLCLFRMKVTNLSAIEPTQWTAFFRTLLEYNAAEMVHAAYGIADDMVLLTASLLLENLDYNEFVGVLEEMVLSGVDHQARLAAFGRPQG